MLDLDARLGLDAAGRLQTAARGVLVAAGRGVADVDLAAGDVEMAPVDSSEGVTPVTRCFATLEFYPLPARSDLVAGIVAVSLVIVVQHVVSTQIVIN